MKTNFWSSAAFVAVLLGSAVGLTFYRADSSSVVASAATSASDPAGREPTRKPSQAEDNRELNAPIESDAGPTEEIVVSFPTWLDPSRMESAVRSAGADPVRIQASAGAVVASVSELSVDEVVQKLQADPRVEDVRRRLPQLQY